MGTTTTFAGLYKGTVGGDEDEWGDDENASQDTLDEILRSLVENGNYAAGSGTDTITVALDPAPATLRDGLGVAWKQATTNTAAPTINVNGLGAKSVKFTDGSSLAAGDLTGGAIYTARYNSTSDAFTINGVGVATASEVAGIASNKAVTPLAAKVVTSGGITEQAIGGRYTKWGTSSVTSNTGGSTTGAATVTFPNAFPSSCDVVRVTIGLPGGGSSGVIYSAWYANKSTTGFTLGITRAGVGTDGPFTVDWEAVGR